MHVFSEGDFVFVLIKRYTRYENWLPVKIVRCEDELCFVPFKISEYTPLPVVLLDYYELDHFDQGDTIDVEYIHDYLGRRSAERNQKNWRKLTDLWASTKIPATLSGTSSQDR